MKLEWINQGSNDTGRELFQSRNVPRGRRDRDTGKITVTGKLYTVHKGLEVLHRTKSFSSRNVRRDQATLETAYRPHTSHTMRLQNMLYTIQGVRFYLKTRECSFTFKFPAAFIPSGGLLFQIGSIDLSKLN